MNTPTPPTTSSSSEERTNWAAIGIVAAISVVLVAMMGYAAFCPWNPFAAERDAQAVAARLQKVGSVAIDQAAAETMDAAAGAKADEAADAAQPAAENTATADAAGDAKPAEETTTADAAPPAAALDAEAGKKLYTGTCQMCHGAGIGGAPKFGSKDEWAPRIATGMDAMMKTVLEGKGAMPARGASTASDDALRAAVQYMVDNAQ